MVGDALRLADGGHLVELGFLVLDGLASGALVNVPLVVADHLPGVAGAVLGGLGVGVLARLGVVLAGCLCGALCGLLGALGGLLALGLQKLAAHALLLGQLGAVCVHRRVSELHFQASGGGDFDGAALELVIAFHLQFLPVLLHGQP